VSATARRASDEPTLAPRVLHSASSVLALTSQLRSTHSVADLARLREQIRELLDAFEARARTAGIEGSRIAQAKEALAALIDLVVTNTPWGTDSGWQRLGAGRPAARLLAVARNSLSDAGVRELIAVVAALGFDKHIASEDAVQVAQLLELLERSSSKPGAGSEWHVSAPRGETSKPASNWVKAALLAVTGIAVAALLAAFHVALESSLGTRFDRVYSELAALDGTLLSRPSEGAR
jgi:type VI protein secretion system component VasF